MWTVLGAFRRGERIWWRQRVTKPLPTHLSRIWLGHEGKHRKLLGIQSQIPEHVEELIPS